MSDNQIHGVDLMGQTFQRLALELLSDGPALEIDVFGTAATFVTDGGLTFKINGSGLGESDGKFTGTASDFSIADANGDATFLFVAPPTLEALFAAARAGSGEANPVNHPEWYDILVPPGGFMFFTGDDKANVGEGSNGGDFADLGKGNDTWIAGFGSDSVTGGRGNDWVDGRELSAGWAFNTGSGKFLVDGGDESNLTGFENARGSLFGDILAGNRKANWLFGEGGDDRLSGKDGDDWLNGGKGRDRLDDGLGSDWLIGGLGRDQFVFRPEAGDNTIADFDPLRDILNVRRFNFESFEQFIGLASDVGANVVIEYGAGFGGGSLELFDVSTADFAGNVRF